MAVRMQVLGPPAVVVLYALEIDTAGAFVTLKIEGTSGDGFATLTPDQAENVAGELMLKAKAARSRSGLVTPSGVRSIIAGDDGG